MLFFYSNRSASTGFFRAAFMVIKATVISVINSASIVASTNTTQLICIWKAKFFNHCDIAKYANSEAMTEEIITSFMLSEERTTMRLNVEEPIALRTPISLVLRSEV